MSIDPYELATMGQNLTNTFTLASNGILVDIRIEDLPDIILPGLDPGGGAGYDGSGWDEINTGSRQDPKTIKRKKITVTAVIEGVTHKKEIIVENKDITIDDIEVNILTEKKTGPKLQVRVLL